MHSICVWDMIKQSKPLQTRYDTTYIYDRYYIRTHVWKKRVWIIAGLTLKVTSWGCPIHGIYRPSLSLDYSNLFEESITLWLWMSGKRNVPVYRGHELANALYSPQQILFMVNDDLSWRTDKYNVRNIHVMPIKNGPGCGLSSAQKKHSTFLHIKHDYTYISQKIILSSLLNVRRELSCRSMYSLWTCSQKKRG